MPKSPFSLDQNFKSDRQGKTTQIDMLQLSQRYAALFDGNFDMVYIHDVKGKIIDANIASSEILGYSKEELIKLSVFDILKKNHHSEVIEIIKHVLSQDSKGAPLQLKVLTKFGEELWVNVKINIIVNKSGAREFIGFAQDITDQKKKEKQLINALKKAEESDRLKSAFLANMSHEIRTPLNAILGFADIIAYDDPDMAQIKNFSGLIVKNGEYLLSILSDIIDSAKIESNKLKIKKQMVDIVDLLIDVDSTMKNSHNFRSKKGVKLVMNYGEDIMCYTDEVRLKQILFNLINNALKFTQKGKVMVSYAIEGEKLKFKVSDTGIGVSPANAAAIFERFGQADINNPANRSGKGLGLSISKGLVELLGGNIHMESEEGVGSSFFFTIDYKQETQA